MWESILTDIYWPFGIFFHIIRPWVVHGSTMCFGVAWMQPKHVGDIKRCRQKRGRWPDPIHCSSRRIDPGTFWPHPAPREQRSFRCKAIEVRQAHGSQPRTQAEKLENPHRQPWKTIQFVVDVFRFLQEKRVSSTWALHVSSFAIQLSEGTKPLAMSLNVSSEENLFHYQHLHRGSTPVWWISSQDRSELSSLDHL